MTHGPVGTPWLRYTREVTDSLTRGLVAPRRARQMLDAAVDVGSTPSEQIYEEHTVEVHHYEPLADSRAASRAASRAVDVPLVIVYAVINRPYLLDLEPGRSVVGRFLERGFDVYLVDWGEPSRLDARLGLGDYADRYLANAVSAVCERTGSDTVDLLGYCTGGTLATIFTALHPDRVNALGLLAPVLAFDTTGGIFRYWGREEYHDPARVVEAFGTVPGEWLAGEFSMVAPVEHYLARYVRHLANIQDEAVARRFARRLRWGMDTVDVPGELYRQFLVDLYRENRLMRGELTVDGTLVDLDGITMPVVDVVGTDDQFVPVEASRPFLEAIPSEDTDLLEVPTDHVGLSISERAHEDAWPRVCDWFARRS